MKKKYKIESVASKLIALEGLVDDYAEFVLSKRYNEDRSRQYEEAIFECAVEIFYGTSIWNYLINKK